jgi:hypothetical protein
VRVFLYFTKSAGNDARMGEEKVGKIEEMGEIREWR